MLIPITLLSQTSEVFKDEFIDTSIPTVNQYSKEFVIDKIYFNKRIDISGTGELLEVEILIKNLEDDPRTLYLFTIATYEVDPKNLNSSFTIPIPPEKRIKTFVPSPGPIDNFQYTLKTKKGNIVKDKKGRAKFKLVKFPIDPKKGHKIELKDKAHIKTYHISKYRANYFFFNNIAVIIFDEKGKPIFRQKYLVKGYRR